MTDELHERRHSTVVLVGVDDGEEYFDMRLTRVPALGEELNREDRSYKVVRVQPEPIDLEGYARFA